MGGSPDGVMYTVCCTVSRDLSVQISYIRDLRDSMKVIPVL